MFFDLHVVVWQSMHSSPQIARQQSWLHEGSPGNSCSGRAHDCNLSQQIGGVLKRYAILGQSMHSRKPHTVKSIQAACAADCHLRQLIAWCPLFTETHILLGLSLHSMQQKDSIFQVIPGSIVQRTAPSASKLNISRILRALLCQSMHSMQWEHSLCKEVPGSMRSSSTTDCNLCQQTDHIL